MSTFDRPCPNLRDDVIRLRAWQTADASMLHEYCQDERIQRFTRVPSPYRFTDAEAFIGDAIRLAVSGSAYHLCISARADSTVVGAVGAVPLSDIEVELGYWVAPEFRGLGAATRALRLVTDWVLHEAGFGRASLLIQIANDWSSNLARKVGFTPTDLAVCRFKGDDVEAVKWVKLSAPCDSVASRRVRHDAGVLTV